MSRLLLRRAQHLPLRRPTLGTAPVHHGLLLIRQNGLQSTNRFSPKARSHRPSLRRLGRPAVMVLAKGPGDQEDRTAQVVLEDPDTGEVNTLVNLKIRSIANPLSRSRRPRPVGLLKLGTIQRLVHAFRLAQRPLDGMVGRQRMPPIRLARLDSWTLE